jgi:hypothetical protein
MGTAADTEFSGAARKRRSGPDRGKEAGSLRAEHQWAVIGAAIAFGLLVTGAFLIVSDLRGTDLATLTKDPVAAGGLDFETGIMSRIGVVIWVAAAVSAVTAGFIAQQLERRDAQVLLSLGLFGLVLAVDDSLMIHEAVSSFTGLPLVEFAYAVALVAILWRLRAEILSQTPWFVLAAALFGLALSEAVDVLDDLLSLGAGAAIEDVCKFIGILLFAAYLLMMVRRVLAAPEPRGSA